MLLLKRKTFEVETESPLVTGDEAAAVAKASDIVAAAEAEAVRIAEAARRAYEDEKVRGYADGLAAARKEELEKKLGLVDSAIAYMAKVELRMGELVVKALRKCVGDLADRDVVVEVVRKAMQTVVRSQRQIRIKVAPALVPAVRDRLDGILTGFPSVAFAEVVEDARLSGTACVVETDAGTVEASVDGQLAAIEKSIARSFTRE